MDEATKHRLNALSTNAENKVKESHNVSRAKTWTTRSENVIVPSAPIFIASTEDIGTNRVRANHFDAAIDYCEEQIALKKANASL
jgi:hypothetical protein